jgi:hypothetical protein
MLAAQFGRQRVKLLRSAYLSVRPSVHKTQFRPPGPTNGFLLNVVLGRLAVKLP